MKLVPPTKPRDVREAFELIGFDPTGRPAPMTASVDRILAQRVGFVSRALASVVLGDLSGGAKAVIAETTVWPSSESDSLWLDYCEANSTRFDTSTGAWQFEFGPHEQERLAGLLMLVVLFGWGTVVASKGGESCFALDHDGNITLWGPDLPTLQRTAKSLGSCR